MIEPLTLGVAELAARWKFTPRQVLQHAQGLGVPLYFAFEGLAFDIGDKWHRANGDWRKRREHDSLEKFIESAESQLQRRARGQLSQWETLTSDEAKELRTRVEADKGERNRLATVLEQRETERNRCDFRGFMRAAPSTLWDIDSLGSAPFPRMAFHPSSPVKVVTLDGKLIWDGRAIDLEPMSGRDRHSKDSLTADDLCALLAEVKAIEACMQAKQPKASPEPQQADTETAPAIAETLPVVVPVQADAQAAPVRAESTKPEPPSATWTLKRPVRDDGLGRNARPMDAIG